MNNSPYAKTSDKIDYYSESGIIRPATEINPDQLMNIMSMNGKTNPKQGSKFIK